MMHRLVAAIHVHPFHSAELESLSSRANRDCECEHHQCTDVEAVDALTELDEIAIDALKTMLLSLQDNSNPLRVKNLDLIEK